MKKYKNIFGLLLLLTSAFSLEAQPYKANEVKTIIDGKYTKAMLISLPSEADETKDKWEDYLDDNYDLKLDRVKRKRDTTTYISEKVISDNLNDVSYDIYTKIVENKDGSTDLYTRWAFGSDVLVDIENDPKKAADAKFMMERFSQNLYIEHYTKQLNQFSNQRTDIVKDYNKLGSRNEKLEKRNRKLEKKINNYKGKVDLNKEQKEANRTEMEKLDKISNSLGQKIDVIQFELKKVKE